MAPKLNRRRAVFVLSKIDEILDWEKATDRERGSKFVELGRYLCEVDRYLTGKDTKLWEIISFKGNNGQLPAIEQALETVALVLGSDKSRGYCQEMICADFLEGVSLEAGNRDALLPCLTRLVIGLPKPERKQLLEEVQVTL